MTIVRGLAVPECSHRRLWRDQRRLANRRSRRERQHPSEQRYLGAIGSYGSVLSALFGVSLLLVAAFWLGALLAARRVKNVP